MNCLHRRTHLPSNTLNKTLYKEIHKILLNIMDVKIERDCYLHFRLRSECQEPGECHQSLGDPLAPPVRREKLSIC